MAMLKAHYRDNRESRRRQAYERIERAYAVVRLAAYQAFVKAPNSTREELIAAVCADRLVREQLPIAVTTPVNELLLMRKRGRDLVLDYLRDLSKFTKITHENLIATVGKERECPRALAAVIVDATLKQHHRACEAIGEYQWGRGRDLVRDWLRVWPPRWEWTNDQREANRAYLIQIVVKDIRHTNLIKSVVRELKMPEMMLAAAIVDAVLAE